MRFFFSLFAMGILLTSCTHRYRIDPVAKLVYERSTYREDTLICKVQSCTECLDLYIVKGKLTVPQALIRTFCNDSTRDFKVCGNFPLDLIDMTAFNFKPDVLYQITGKIVSLDKDNGIGEVPLFYVNTWKILENR